MSVAATTLFFEQATEATSRALRIEGRPTAWDIHIDGTGTVELYVTNISGPSGADHDKWGAAIATWTASTKVEKDADAWEYARIRVIPGPSSTITVAVGARRLGD